MTSEYSFKWRLQRLHEESGVYHSPSLNPSKTWKETYIEKLALKNLWENTSQDNIQGSVQNMSIQVTVRFKPKDNEDNSSPKNQYLDKKLTLPLHQRLALIKMNRNLASNKDALQVLREQGDWFGENNGEALKDDNNGSDMKKALHSKNQPPALSGVTYIDCKNNSAVVVDRMKGLREFTFDKVLPEQSSQSYVYETTAMPLVSDFLNGFNATCLVYGQTGR